MKDLRIEVREMIPPSTFGLTGFLRCEKEFFEMSNFQIFAGKKEDFFSELRLWMPIQLQWGWGLDFEAIIGAIEWPFR